MKCFFSALLCMIMPMLAFAGPSSIALQADTAYTDGDYVRALRLYDQAVRIDGVSPELYYNIGNTYYRIGKLGRAVINYHRALALDPSFKEAQENLNFVNTKILDKPEDDSSFLGNVHNSITAWLSPNAWAWTAFALFALVLGCVALYLFADNVAIRKTGFFGGIVLLFFMAYSIAVAAVSASAHDRRDRAVVIVPTTNLSTTPGNIGKEAKIIPVHEGTLVEIMDSTAIPGATSAPLWYEVKINNATRAWVNAADVERI